MLSLRQIGLTLNAIVGVFIIAGLSCGSAPNAPEYDNPIIPDDPNYEAPQTTILSGPVEGAVVDSHAVSFTWAGNQDSMTFARRLNEGSWSDWLLDTTATFQYLDEGGYRFEVQGQYASGVIEDTAAARSFTIDDIHGPALWLYPRYQEVNQGSIVTVEVMLEDVADVLSVKAALTYNPGQLQITAIEVYEDDRSLLKSTGGTIIAFSIYDNTAGLATIEVATATGNPAGVSGTGAIAVITLTANQSGQLVFGAASSLRDVQNKEIPISEAASTAVEVK